MISRRRRAHCRGVCNSTSTSKDFGNLLDGGGGGFLWIVDSAVCLVCQQLDYQVLALAANFHERAGGLYKSNKTTSDVNKAAKVSAVRIQDNL